ncbi:MAG: ATP-binding protein [Deltaproteobacteria bacterium]
MSAAPAPAAPLQAHWLVRLRWAAIVAQVVSIVGVKFLLKAPFDLPPLVINVGLLATANVVLTRWLRGGRTLSEGAITANILLDIVALTLLLIWTGGAMNPFTTIYLLHVALAAILVGRRWSLAVTLAAVVAFGGLLLARPEAIHVWHSGAMFMLHVRGMWIAFALTAGCLWFFVERVTSALHRRDEELANARLGALHAERLAALGALAAGTAHELNTPLGTVAILASELVAQLPQDAPSRAYAESIRAEVRRCTAILTKMRSHDAQPGPRVSVVLASWVVESVAAWSETHGSTTVPVQIDAPAIGLRANVQPEMLRQALHSVLDNAREAVAARSGEIAVSVRQEGEHSLCVSVVDGGPGMSDDQIARVGEPFFTTREPGQGMGLGLFLAQATIAQHDGALSIRSRAGHTEVTLRLPVSVGSDPAHER